MNLVYENNTHAFVFRPVWIFPRGSQLIPGIFKNELMEF